VLSTRDANNAPGVGAQKTRRLVAIELEFEMELELDEWA